MRLKRAISLFLMLLLAIPSFAYAEPTSDNLDPAVPLVDDFMIGGDGDVSDVSTNNAPAQNENNGLDIQYEDIAEDQPATIRSSALRSPRRSTRAY